MRFFFLTTQYKHFKDQGVNLVGISSHDSQYLPDRCILQAKNSWSSQSQDKNSNVTRYNFILAIAPNDFLKESPVKISKQKWGKQISGYPFNSESELENLTKGAQVNYNKSKMCIDMGCMVRAYYTCQTLKYFLALDPIRGRKVFLHRFQFLSKSSTYNGKPCRTPNNTFSVFPVAKWSKLNYNMPQSIQQSGREITVRFISFDRRVHNIHTLPR